MNLTDNTPTNSDKIVRQNSLAHADAMIQRLTNEEDTWDFIEEKYFAFAKRCEEWVNRKK